MHILDVLTTAARKNGPSVAAEAKRSMAGVFELAMATLRVDRDPVYPVRRALPPNKTQHKRALRGITGHHEHLFPGRDDRSKPMAIASFRQALHVLGWSGQYSPHATRTTGSTRLNEMGYRPDWIERQLAHVEPNAVRRTNNHAEYLADRAVMMQRWADLLDEWEKAAATGTAGTAKANVAA